VVEELITAGADFKIAVASGFTPFLFAVREGQLAVAKVLLKAGVDVNDTIERQRRGRRGSYGRLQGGTSALLLAASNAHFEMAAMLLDAGADPNANEPGYTTLHVIPSVRNPGIGDNDPPPPGSGNMTSIELVKKLVKKGADVNARMAQQVNLGNTRLNKLGATPYFLAAQSADTELMRTLVELGADPLLKNVENSTALMAIAGIGTRSPGEDAGTGEEMVEAMRLALDLGDDINAVDDDGETAMHGAAYKNSPLAVEFLDAKGADPGIWNRKNAHGWTPLSIADGYRFGNFKPSPVTVEAILKVMASHGLSRPVDGEPVRGKEIY
jgi:ankyrin repeat protein